MEPWMIILISIGTFILGGIVGRCTHRTPPQVPGEYYEKEIAKMKGLAAQWIQEEMEASSLTADASGFTNTFLGQISQLDIKTIGKLPEVAIKLDMVLKDTKDIRTLSRFLDLVRRIDINVDAVVLAQYKMRYYTSLLQLGPNDYTYTKKQLTQVMAKYPWLWLVELLAEDPIVIEKVYGSKYRVDVDMSKATRTPFNVQQVGL